MKKHFNCFWSAPMDTCLLMFCVGSNPGWRSTSHTYPAARLCEIMFISELGDFRIFPDSSGFPDSTQNGFRISGLGGGLRGPRFAAY